MFGSGRRIVERLVMVNHRLEAIERIQQRILDNESKTIYPMLKILFDERLKSDSELFARIEAAGSRDAHGNPYDPARRSSLLEEYRMGTITASGADELSGYLREDEERAARSSNTGTALLLLGVIGALAGVGLALATSKKDPSATGESSSTR